MPLLPQVVNSRQRGQNANWNLHKRASKGNQQLRQIMKQIIHLPGMFLKS